MLVRVGDAGSVASGKMIVVDLSGTKVAVASDGGRLYAFDTACTHEGCSLAGGTLKGTTVTCPCHGSQFNVSTGAVVRGPATVPVATHRVEIIGQDLLVGD